MGSLLDTLLRDYEGVRSKYRDNFAGLKATQPPVYMDAPAANTVPVSLFYRLFNKPNAVGSVQLDLILSEQHALTSTVSEHPVEEGETVSDHIQQNLRTGSLKGLVSNFSVQAGGGDGQTNRAMSAWQLFQNLWKARALVTIVTTLEVYDNVAVTSVTTGRDGTSGDALEFSVDFRQIKRADLKEATVTAVASPKAMDTPQRKKSAVKAKKGRETGKDATMDLGGVNLASAEYKIVGRPGL